MATIWKDYVWQKIELVYLLETSKWIVRKIWRDVFFFSNNDKLNHFDINTDGVYTIA